MDKQENKYTVLVSDLPREELLMLLNWLDQQKLRSFWNVEVHTNTSSLKVDKDD
jgi:hypothetical protein